MMKNLICMALLALMPAAGGLKAAGEERITVDEWLTVEVTAPGMLVPALEEALAQLEPWHPYDLLDVKLRLSGTLDASDVRWLRWLTGAKNSLTWMIGDDDPAEGYGHTRVTALDLGQTTLQTGGWYAHVQTTGSEFYMLDSDDTLGPELFAESRFLSQLVLPEGVRVVQKATVSSTVSDLTLPSTLGQVEAGELKWATTVTCLAVEPPVVTQFEYGSGRDNQDYRDGTYTPIMFDPRVTADWQLLEPWRKELKGHTLVVPAGTKEKYAVSGVWSCFGTIVEADVTTDVAAVRAADKGSEPAYTLGGRLMRPTEKGFGIAKSRLWRGPRRGQ